MRTRKAVVDKVGTGVEDEQDLLDVGGEEVPLGRDEAPLELALAPALVPVELELVDVQDDAGEMAEEERHRDAGEDDHQRPLVAVVHTEAGRGRE